MGDPEGAASDDDPSSSPRAVATPSESGHTTSEQLGLGPDVSYSVVDRIGLAVERIDELRDRPVLVGGLLALAVGLVLLVPRLVESAPTSPIEDRIPQVALAPTTAIGAEDTALVHVSGAVDVPGVYTLDASARVVDAVEAAGGATGEAELHRLNLAAVVVDGQQIHVPAVGEIVVQDPVSTTGPVDVNRADVIALQTLPGVGPATAEAIVAYRDEHGPFRSVDDLLDVPGIGPSKLAAIAAEAAVG